MAHRDEPSGVCGFASHALMAAGMASMLAPVHGGALTRGLWQAAYAAGCAFFVVSMVRGRRLGPRSGMPAPLHHAMCNAAMVYMLAMPSLSVLVITTILIAYFMVSVLVDGYLLARSASQGSASRWWETVSQGTRILMAGAMVYMFAVMDVAASAGMHHHHLQG
ncbi:MAG TPA: DUF5134 domain-containing protein [Candidatus Dormibacteraeota bacterium]